MNRLLALCICMGICLSLLLSACDSPKPTVKATPTPGILPDSQQTLKATLITGTSDIATLDPALVNGGASLEPVELVFPALVTLNAQLQPEPWVAMQAPDLGADGLTYTFHLRPNLTFSDGEAIDARAFAYAINRTLNPCTASPSASYLFAIKDAQTFNQEVCNASDGALTPSNTQTTPPINSLIGDALTVVDPQTLQITLSQPTPYFLSELAYPAAYAVPRNLIMQYGASWPDQLAALHFSGNLFTVSAWDHTGTLTLRRNSLFWGNHPKLSTIVFTVSATPQASYSGYQSGQQDVATISTQEYQALKQSPSVTAQGLLATDYYGMNWTSPPFDDLRMRQAFAVALDKQSLVTTVLNGAAIPTNHIIPLGMPGYDADLLSVDGTQGVTGDSALANQLESQYVNNACHGKVSTCPSVTLTLPRGDATANAEAQAALRMWKAAMPGYPITIATRDANGIQSSLATHTLQFWASSWSAQYPDPHNALSQQYLPAAPNNAGAVNQADATVLMQKADSEQDPASRLKDYEAAEQLLVTYVACVPLQQRELFYLVRANVKGYALTALGVPALDTWQQIYLMS